MTYSEQIANTSTWFKDRGRGIRNVMYLGFLLFLRDFQYRFKQTYLGYTWAFFKPLLTGVPIIMVGSQFNFGADERLGISYPLYAFVGLMLWQVFWDGLFYPQWIMRRTRKILTRARFPYRAILAASFCYVCFNIIIYTLMIFAAVLIFGGKPGAAVVLGVLSLPLLMICGLAIGTFLAPSVLVYLDLRYGLPMVSSVLMWSVPTVYVTPESGPLAILNALNPVTYLLNTPRAWLTGGGTPEPDLFVITLAGFFVLFLLSMKFYERTLRIAVDQIL